MKSENPLLRIGGVLIRVILIIVAAMFVIRVAKIAYEYGYETFAQKPVSNTGQIITITVNEQDDTKAVAKLLEERGLVRDDLLFRMQELFSDYHGMIAPGIYELSTDMTPEEMLAVMSAKTLEMQAAQEEALDGNSLIGGAGEDADDAVPENDTGEDAQEPE